MDGDEFLVPFECNYNDQMKLQLTSDGNVYIADKKHFTRQKLSIVNGEWSFDAGDRWQSIFDF